MKTYRFTVDVTADEDFRLLNTENVRLAVADAAYSQVRVIGVQVDGRDWDPISETLEESPITEGIAQLIAEGRTIQAIKELRAATEGMTLGEAKNLVDKWRANR